MKNLEQLAPDDLQQLENALPQIAILIAGADGAIDHDEELWAEKVAHIRSFAGDKTLHDFYEQVDANFSIKFHDLQKLLPDDTAARQDVLSAALEKINPILAKLDASTAYKLYHGFVTFAKSIAKSSGGFMGMGAISRDEKQWIGLPMLHKIVEPSDEPEAEV